MPATRVTSAPTRLALHFSCGIDEEVDAGTLRAAGLPDRRRGSSPPVRRRPLRVGGVRSHVRRAEARRGHDARGSAVHGAQPASVRRAPEPATAKVVAPRCGGARRSVGTEAHAAALEQRRRVGGNFAERERRRRSGADSGVSSIADHFAAARVGATSSLDTLEAPLAGSTLAISARCGGEDAERAAAPAAKQDGVAYSWRRSQGATLAPLALALSVAPPLDTVVVGAGSLRGRAAALLGAGGVARLRAALAAAMASAAACGPTSSMASSLHRGFAVFLSAYPESQAALDYDALAQEIFEEGAMVQRTADRCLIADPTRAPLSNLAALRFPIGTVAEKVRLSLAVLRLKLTSLEAIFARDEIDTLSHLRDRIGARRFGAHRALLHALLARDLPRAARATVVGPLRLRPAHVCRRRRRASRTRHRRRRRAARRHGAHAGCDIQLESAVGALRLDVGDGAHEVVLARRLGSPLRKRHSRDAAGRGGALAALGVRGAGMVGRYRSLEPASGASLASTTIYFALDGPPPVARARARAQRPARRHVRINSVCFPSAVCERYARSGRHLASVTLLGARIERRRGARGVGARGARRLVWSRGGRRVEASSARTWCAAAAWLGSSPPAWAASSGSRAAKASPASISAATTRSTPSLNGALRAGHYRGGGGDFRHVS